MDRKLISDFSTRLKEIAKDLSFLGHPRYPVKRLLELFPQHKTFIAELEDVSVPFNVKIDEKRKLIDVFLHDLSRSDLNAPMKKVFTGRVQDYLHLLAMIDNFGSVFFYDHCTRLYGTSHRHAKNPAFQYFLERVPQFCHGNEGPKDYQGETALAYLRTRMLETFPEGEFEVKASTSLLSDSSAGRRALKLNTQKAYSKESLDIFLVHEGWVHLGTSLNGAKQVDNPWLSTWAPRTTFMQEGLAILVELITGTMGLERWNRVLLRHLSTGMAERGSSITDVYAFLRHSGLEDIDALKLALRVFRGVPLEGGMAFTKELLYLHGLVELLFHLHFFKTDLRSLWVGKLSFEEHIVLLNDWDRFGATVTYFPEALASKEAEERLQKLKELCFGFFNHGFL